MFTDTLTDNTTDTDTDTSTAKRIIPRSDDKIVRLDVRFPKPMHDEIEALAIAGGAAIHHISKRPTLTPTILKLIQYGLDHCPKGELEQIQVKSVSGNRVTDNCIDLEALNGEMERLRGEVEQLRGEIANTQPPAIDQNIEDRLANLESAQVGKS
jgi:hypothetical protein